MDELEFDDRDDPIEDHEFPEPDSWDDAPPTAPCPQCGSEIYDDAEQCPVCGDYLLADRNVWTGRTWWWVVLGLLGIATTTLALALW